VSKLEKKRSVPRKSDRTNPIRVLIVGAGVAGQMVAQVMAEAPEHGYVVIGFLDDAPEKLGQTISGTPVLGRIGELVAVAQEHEAEEIVIAIPTASGRTVREVVRLCEEAGRPFKIVPGVWEIIRGDVAISQIRDVVLDDLLGRETVALDTDEMSGYLEGRSVLVTGAGGSIGSELARQVADFRPKKLLLMGRGENSVYEIDQELALLKPGLTKVPIIGSVVDSVAVEKVFRQHRPEIVFHAAAHKHVPFMEYFPDEAVKNNVTGTRILADAAIRHGADRLVMLSTDKAVVPGGVMGATKRLAELLLIARALRGSATKLIAVRFGNVLGSRGSVIPLFREQIREGGPLTVTHPDVTRYFMTIREAAMLVLEAGLLGQGGEIFVLDMGEPIRISELAEHLVRLSGMEPGRDIAIEYRGLRAGEKLHEELWSAEETLSETKYEKILVVKSAPIQGLREIERAITRLEELAGCGDSDGVLRDLANLFEGMRTERDDESKPAGS
jgi:FlaA1/EpsC-like NDP-sugar epimerase